jgi:hypothetical protein
MPECPICRSSFSNDTCRALHLIGPNGQEVMLSCPICLETKAQDQFCVLPCGHNLCFQCAPMVQFQREDQSTFSGNRGRQRRRAAPAAAPAPAPAPAAPPVQYAQDLNPNEIEYARDWIRRNIPRRERVATTIIHAYPAAVRQYIRQNWNTYPGIRVNGFRNSPDDPTYFRPGSRSDTAAQRRSGQAAAAAAPAEAPAAVPPTAAEQTAIQWLRTNGMSRRQRLSADDMQFFPGYVRDYIRESWNTYDLDPRSDPDNPWYYRPGTRPDMGAQQRAEQARLLQGPDDQTTGEVDFDIDELLMLMDIND